MKRSFEMDVLEIQCEFSGKWRANVLPVAEVP